jgi:hypothetical protein|tara:strand:- start:4079 stop:4315 length:237 start_codon:yes stop_codon:yes gene_type:complete
MYRVTIYREELLIIKFLEDLISQAVGRARQLGQHGDHVYIHEVIQSADGNLDEVECVLKTTLQKKINLDLEQDMDITI